ncbi:MAG: hypothetical protein AAFY88_13060 [Acidobacteriota bacterium]
MVEPVPELLTALASLVLFLGFHVAVWRRLGASRAGFGLMVALWACATAAALPVAALLLGGVHALTVVALNGLWMAFYLHLYTGMLRSVSLRVLGELRAGPRSRRELFDVYPPATMLDERLAWMAERGLVASTGTGDAFTVTPAGRRLLAVRRPLVRLMVDGPTG